MGRPAVPAPKAVRRPVSIPGVLADTMRARWAEFGYPGFSPFALELICFDLRIRREHDLTLFFAQQPPAIQAALDRELKRQYRPGPERCGILVQEITGERLPAVHPAPRGDFARFRGHVRFSELLAPCLEIRWAEAGYATFSDYVTAILRYDLLLLGQHKYFNGDDVDPEILASLDRGTAAEFYENRQPKRIYLDRLLDQAAARKLTPDERRAALQKVAEQLLQRAQEADRREKHT